MARNDNRPREVLGIGNPSSSSVENRSSESEAEKRHRRMSEGADELTPSPTPPHRGSGATGIDMGSGGEGTDLE
jgi:hypothetical protein